MGGTLSAGSFGSLAHRQQHTNCCWCAQSPARCQQGTANSLSWHLYWRNQLSARRSLPLQLLMMTRASGSNQPTRSLSSLQLSYPHGKVLCYALLCQTVLHSVQLAAALQSIGRCRYLLSTVLSMWNRKLLGKENGGVLDLGPFPGEAPIQKQTIIHMLKGAHKSSSPAAPLLMSSLQFGGQIFLARVVLRLGWAKRHLKDSLSWRQYMRYGRPSAQIL